MVYQPKLNEKCILCLEGTSYKNLQVTTTSYFILTYILIYMSFSISAESFFTVFKTLHIYIYM